MTHDPDCLRSRCGFAIFNYGEGASIALTQHLGVRSLGLGSPAGTHACDLPGSVAVITYKAADVLAWLDKRPPV